ncbi:MAG: Wzz/FepE/Etk N-terminal domain-containing protein [Terriglobales bacterium]|jgi:capsule polysaccharide export protein KpsE/RkpR
MSVQEINSVTEVEFPSPDDSGNLKTVDTVTKNFKPALDNEGAVAVASTEDELLELHTQGHIIALLWPLWSRRNLLLRALVAGFVLSAVIAFLVIPKRYVSTVQLLPPQDSSGALYAMLANAGGSGGALTMASDLLGVKTSGAIFVAMLQSRTVQDEIVNGLDLRKVYQVRRQVDARKLLEDNTEISEDRKSGVITLNVKDRDPKRAAAMAHGYVESLNRVITRSTTSAAHRERVFLEERLQAVKQDLESSEKQFSEFSSKNNTLDIKDQGRAMLEGAATVQGQLIAEESQLKGLQQIYAADNFRIRSANARIAELKHQLSNLAGTSGSASGDPDAGSGSQYPSIRNLPLLGATWADLYRQTKLQEAIFEALTKQYELAKVQEVKEIPSVGVLDDAEVPEKKASPPRIIVTFCGTLLALLFGALYIIGVDVWSRVDPASPFRTFVATISSEVTSSGIGKWIGRFRKQSKIRDRVFWWRRQQSSVVQNASD